MSVRNTKLGGVDWTSTSEATYTDFNDTFNKTIESGGELPLTQAGINTIRIVQDRAITFGKGNIDGFAEAYVDADGRNGTVITASTDATFDTDKYKATGTAESVILHSVTSDILPDNVNLIFGVPLIEDWESNNSITYKVYNSTTDTGYKSIGSTHIVTEFDAPITRLSVKLSPVGTAAYPSINGFFIYGDNI